MRLRLQPVEQPCLLDGRRPLSIVFTSHGEDDRVSPTMPQLCRPCRTTVRRPASERSSVPWARQHALPAARATQLQRVCVGAHPRDA